jgi:hypothetical protein
MNEINQVDHDFHSGPLVLAFHNHALGRFRRHSFRGTAQILYISPNLIFPTGFQGHKGRLEEARSWIFRERLQRSTLRTGTRRSPAHPTAATYLGIDVAIKEVLPSTDYDVAKYFEREWRLMKSALM